MPNLTPDRSCSSLPHHGRQLPWYAHTAPVPEPIEDPLPGEHPVPQEDPVPSPNPETVSYTHLTLPTIYSV